jgi:hypothetical protein
VSTVEVSPNGGAPAPAGGGVRSLAGLTSTRPELVVAAAFAGGIAIAILAKRLGR